MRQFDEMLRRGLMAANLAEYTSELDDLPSWEPDFSPKYRRERTRLLANPRSWARRRARPVWKRAARTAACVALACTVALGALMAASPTVRAAVNTWLRQITRNSQSVEIQYSPSDPNETALTLPWRLTWLPEGWTLDERYIRGDSGTWIFCMTGNDGVSKENLSFSCTNSDTLASFSRFPEPNFTLKGRPAVHGRPADYYEGEHYRMLAWEEVDKSLLEIVSRLDIAPLEQIAESAEPWSGVQTEYEVGHTPEGHTEQTIQFSRGVGEWTWLKNHTQLDLLYVNDPICPFTVPSRTPEEVTVNGLPGLFWPSTTSTEEWFAEIAVEQLSPDAVITCGTEEVAVLTWEDPETSTIFRLRGVAEKEEMLRTAESVTKKSS